MLKDIGKTIIRGAAVMVGTKHLAKLADKAIPVVAGRSKDAWSRIKGTKSTGRKREQGADPPKNYKEAKTSSVFYRDEVAPDENEVEEGILEDKKDKEES